MKRRVFIKAAGALGGVPLSPEPGGSDRIVVGTDSFNARDIEYPSAVVEQFKLAAVDRDRILKGNAIRLFRL